MSALTTLDELNETYNAMPEGPAKDTFSKTVAAFLESAVVAAGFTQAQFYSVAGLKINVDALLDDVRAVFTLGSINGFTEFAPIATTILSSIRSMAELQREVDNKVFEGKPVFSTFKPDIDFNDEEFSINKLAVLVSKLETAKPNPTLDIIASAMLGSFGRPVGYTGKLSGPQLVGLGQDFARVFKTAAHLPSMAQRLAHPGLATAALAFNEFILAAGADGRQYADATGADPRLVFAIGGPSTGKAATEAMARVMNTMRELAAGNFNPEPITTDDLDKLRRDIAAEKEQYTQ